MTEHQDTGLLAERALHSYLERVRRGDEVEVEEFAESLEVEVRSEFRRLFDDYEALRTHLGGGAAALRAGSVLGDFELVVELGRGGMGVVWEARQRSLDRRVALKLLSPVYALTPEALSRFQREAEAAARVSHPSIVAVHSIGEAAGHRFIAQELVPGGFTLADSVAEWTALAELPGAHFRRVAELVADVAGALQHAHESGIVHRDVKPGNILMTEEGRPKVADFGLAKLEDGLGLSTTGDMLGTPFYMSPEQALGRRSEVGPSSDVFSLGATLYECLTLRRAFDGDSSQQVVDRILHHDPPLARNLRAHVPSELAILCAKALEKDPDERYASMADLAADLRRFLAHEPILAQPPSALQRLRKWCRRHPTRASIAALGGAAFLVISALTGVLLRSSAENRLQEEEVAYLVALEECDRLRVELDALWPVHPDRAPELRDWLARARAVEARLPRQVERLEQLRGLSGSDSERAAALGRLEGVLEQLVREARELTHPETGVLYAGTSSRHGWSVAERLRLAEQLAQSFSAGGKYADEWAAHRGALRASYPAVELPVQVGLVPLGEDPASGLWEFWHVLSGSRPRRDDRGRHVVDGGSGMVLVLVPGGTTLVGAQDEDPSKPRFDPELWENEAPPHEVSFSPFFLSKYEMTAGQWERATGTRPSYWTEDLPEESLLAHPVEAVSWRACRDVVQRLGLALPTEAQWEYACRSGSDGPFPFDEGECAEHANLRDESWSRLFSGTSSVEGDDGHALHAPVGSLVANAWGFHDMIGNVWEWCADALDDGYYARSPSIDPYREPTEDDAVVYRGGSFKTDPRQSRVSRRGGGSQTNEIDGDTGVRPARPVVR